MANAGEMRTVGDVVGWWLRRVEQKFPADSKYRQNVISMATRNVLPALGRVSIKKLDRRVVDDKLIWRMGGEGKKAGTQQKAIQVLRRAFATAEKTGRIKLNPMASITFKDFDSAPIKSKPAALSRIDLPPLVAQLSEAFDKDPVNGLLPLMMLAHGTRITETIKATWSHISRAEQFWVIPANKSSRLHEIPLTPQVLALLARYREALPDARARTDWLFPVRGGNRLSSTRASAMFRSISGRKWCSHDLRKLMRASLSELGVDHFIAERLINHSLGKTAETYLTRDVAGRCREALELWHARLDECGFSIAHGLNNAAGASPQISGGPVMAVRSADSSVFTGRG